MAITTTPVYVADIEKETINNPYYRDVRPELTSTLSQVVFMSLPAGSGGHIAGERHDNVEQVFRVERGQINVVFDGKVVYQVKAGGYMTIPRGQWHEIFSLGDDNGNPSTPADKRAPTKLYTIYIPPVHKPGKRQPYKPEHDDDDDDGH